MDGYRPNDASFHAQPIPVRKLRVKGYSPFVRTYNMKHWLRFEKCGRYIRTTIVMWKWNGDDSWENKYHPTRLIKSKGSSEAFEIRSSQGQHPRDSTKYHIATTSHTFDLFHNATKYQRNHLHAELCSKTTPCQTQCVRQKYDSHSA